MSFFHWPDEDGNDSDWRRRTKAAKGAPQTPPQQEASPLFVCLVVVAVLAVLIYLAALHFWRPNP